MKSKAVVELTVCFAIMSLVFLGGCGSDESAPSIDTSFIPQTVFFNDTGSTEYYLFQGRATDNTNVDSVEVSGDNGTNWQAAVIDNDPPNEDWDAQWSYLASSGVLSAGMHTVLVRAADRDGNETISTPVIVDVNVGSTIGSLLAVFSGPLPGGAIGLSTGEGFAYGDSAGSLTIPINTSLIVLGSGYGSTATSGGLIPLADPTATILEADPATASLFSVDADLTLKNMRLLGAESAIRISDSGGPDPQLSVEACLFDKQAAWAIFAEDDDTAVSVEVAASIVDASQADSSSRGGIYLSNVSYSVDGSAIYFQTDPGGPADSTVQGAGVQAFEGTGEITETVFEDNALAIWASGGDSVITSCNISSTANTTYGINLTGDPGTALIRRNTIDGNTGYGLRVGGEMELILRKNAITNNELSGVLIDSTLSNTNLTKINMGTTTDRGNNLFDNNVHPDGAGGQDTQVYVTLATSEGSTLIPANWNYWGVSTISGVNLVIIDGNDNAGRATLGIGSFWSAINSEVGP